MRATYIVRPRPGGDGFTLSGTMLGGPLWYREDAHAVDYAHHLMRLTGGRVVVLDSRGNTIVSESTEPRACTVI